MGVHDGHRSRMKERFRGHGLENFTDKNALELLLFYAAPRRDTNGMAHALLERFGSFSAVLEANEQELLAVPGIGENAVTLLRLIPEVSRRHLNDHTPQNAPVAARAAADFDDDVFVVVGIFRDKQDFQFLGDVIERGFE